MIYTRTQLDNLQRYIKLRKPTVQSSPELRLLFHYLERLTETSLYYYPGIPKRVDLLFKEIESIFEESKK
jgi:hypothetical protein